MRDFVATRALLLLPVLLLYHGLCESDVSTAPMERAEQEALYKAIQGFVGQSWNGWRLYPDPCGWTPIQGVSCDLFHGLWYITSLNIGPVLDNSLECSRHARFTPQLFELKHLKILSFFNCFSSRINTSTTTMPYRGWQKLAASLETLEFRSNLGLIGEIPTSVGQLTNLQSLVLVENGFKGQLPIELGNLVHLKRLSLTGNRFFGQIPASLGNNMNDLLILDLSRNLLSGSISSSLGRLSSLVKLDLSDNLLQGELPRELGELRNLTLLDLRNNRLSGGLTQFLQGMVMVALQDMLLSNNTLGGNLTGFGWENLRYLTTLDLSSNGLTGEIPESIAGLKRLRYLALDNNQLTGGVPSRLGALPCLGALYLSSNNLTGELGFSEEFYEKMGTRFACWHNPNLCYSVGVTSARYAPLGVEQCKHGQLGGSVHEVNSQNRARDENSEQHSSLIASFGFSATSISTRWWLVLAQEVVVFFHLVLLS